MMWGPFEAPRFGGSYLGSRFLRQQLKRQHVLRFRKLPDPWRDPGTDVAAEDDAAVVAMA